MAGGPDARRGPGPHVGRGGGCHTALLRSDRTAGGHPALVEDLIAIEVTTPSCAGEMGPPGHPALDEDLTYAQVAAGGNHAVLLWRNGAAAWLPALVEDLTYAPVALGVSAPSVSGVGIPRT